MWNTIKRLNGKNTRSTPNIMITINGKPAITPQQKTTATNKQFVNTVLHKSTSTNRKIDKHTKHLLPALILITPSQVQAAIYKVHNNNSTGPDNINIRHLRHLGLLAIKYLSELFTRALSLNVILHIWKLAKIIPIAKPNKDINQGISYRPILLLFINYCKNCGESSATVYNTTHT